MLQHVARPAEQPADRFGADGEEGGGRHAEQDRQPQRLHADVGGARAIAGAHPPGDPLGGAIGEEVGADDDERQHGGGQRQSGELGGAEAPDDRRVDEHVERLDRQRPEGGDRQRDEPPIGGIEEPTDQTTRGPASTQAGSNPIAE